MLLNWICQPFRIVYAFYIALRLALPCYSSWNYRVLVELIAADHTYRDSYENLVELDGASEAFSLFKDDPQYTRLRFTRYNVDQFDEIIESSACVLYDCGWSEDD